MEVKVGQWVRYKDGSILPIENYLDLEEAKQGEANGNCIFGSTPQELTLKGDMIYSSEFSNYGKQEIINKLRDTVDTSGGKRIKVKTITAIYTPNEDKTQYTEQWRVK